MTKKILIIDDEELVVKSVGRLLTKEGFEVFICRNGDEAIEKIKNATIDLIVCDIRMPQLSGIETIKNIRKILKTKNQKAIPEILISGYADQEATKQADDLKVADYLYKPFDLRDFLNCIKKNLEN